MKKTETTGRHPAKKVMAENVDKLVRNGSQTGISKSGKREVQREIRLTVSCWSLVVPRGASIEESRISRKRLEFLSFRRLQRKLILIQRSADSSSQNKRLIR
jgi:hypothetical protein